MEPIRINGTEIPAKAIAAEMQNHPAGAPEQAWQAAARALVLRELLVQQARAIGIETGERTDAAGRRLTESEALIESLLAHEIQTPLADEATCRRYYAQNQARFRSPDLYEAAHILIAARPDDKAAYADAVKLAEELIAELATHPNRFAELALSHSACPSAKTGGSLGQVTKGQTVQEFETFLFALEDGQLCPVPVKTRYGVHVIRLVRKVEGILLPFESVAEKIAGFLEEASYRRAVTQYLHLLVGRATVEGIDLEGAHSPLVQ